MLYFLVILVGGCRRFGESCGLQLFYLLNLEGGEALALRLESLDGYELLGVNLLGTAEGVVASVGHQQARVNGVRQQQLLVVGILAQVVLLALRGLHLESLDIRIALVVGIE